MSREPQSTPCFRAAFNTDHRGVALDGQSRIELTIERQDQRLLVHVRAPFFGDPPPSTAVGPTWELWKHEVVELFFVGHDERYLEIELSPHGHHLVLTLQGVRNIEQRLLPIRYEAEIETKPSPMWAGTAEIPMIWVPQPTLRFNAFAIHGQGAQRRHMALYPGTCETPDFHQIHDYPPAPPELFRVVCEPSKTGL